MMLTAVGAPLSSPHRRQLAPRPSGRGRICTQPRIVCSGSKQANVLTVGIVALLTEGLRLAGVGKKQYPQPSALPARKLRRGDIGGLIKRIRADFEKNAYIVTGIIDDEIYDEDCLFADPTVSFSGVDLWKRNLQLLVPFLIKPSVDLLSIQKLVPTKGDGAKELVSEWKLETTLALPWRPLISILGTTRYTLNDDSKIVKHVESWNVSGTAALLQILRPGPGDE